MTLPPGSRLGDYEIVAPLGAGGMGEVYRARDTQLHREVAVKVLNEAVKTAGTHSVARFEREARSVAALSHPNILEVHHFGSESGVPYLVTELLEGETLRQRINRGALSWRKAVEIAAPICDGLAAAHAKGIIHRDLKPENIFITGDGRVKILDFGLAGLESQPESSQSSATPLITEPGTVMGTPAYMSPEQVRGERVDATTDLFALGCTIYEMIGGQSPFARPTRSEIMTAILRDEPPDLSTIKGDVPAALTALIDRCLVKEKEQRFQSARDLSFDLHRLIDDGGSPRSSSRKLWIAIGVAAALGIALVYLVASGRWRRNSPETNGTAAMGPQGRDAKILTQLTSAKSVEQFPSWSPDGTRLVYSRETGKLRKIFVKTVGEPSERQLTQGEFDEIQPSWSADGKTIVFVRATESGVRMEPADVFAEYDVEGDIWSLDLGSAREERLLRNASNPSWSPDGQRIAFAASWSGPHRIWTSDARGRNTQQVTTDTSEAVEHIEPEWSPDGARIVFQNMARTQFDIRVVDLASKELHWLTNDATLDVHPVWARSGDAIYFSSYRGGGINVWRVRVDATGKAIGAPEQVTTGAGQDVDLAISRDGKRLAMTTLNQNADLWRLPVSPLGNATGPPEEVVATTREESRGSWSPDSSAIAFNSDRSGQMNIWIRTLGDGMDRQVTRGSGGDFQPVWSPDASRLVFFSGRSGTIDIWEVNVSTGALSRLTDEKSSETHAFYSPDGRRIAYMSDADGRLELWVMNADGTGRRQVTRAGISVHFLRWTPDSSTIFFMSSESPPRVMSIRADGGEPQPTRPVKGGYHISFSPDRSRIMDVLRHRTLWISPLQSGEPEKVFEFEDRDVRIDYPSWSPDGKWVVFDRLRPEGGDIWMLERFE